MSPARAYKGMMMAIRRRGLRTPSLHTESLTSAFFNVQAF